MLRRKFLIRLGLLICAFVLGSVGAIWKLQDVQADLDKANTDAAQLIDGVQAVAIASNEVIALRIETASWDATQREIAQRELDSELAKLSSHPALREPGPAASDMAEFRSALAAMSTSDAAKPNSELEQRVRRSVQSLAKSLRAFVASEQVRVASTFRFTVIALTLAAFAMINVSMWVLFRTTQLVLKPVAALVDGSRELAAENFEHRVKIEPGDEFAELAHAYNALAEHLQSNEQRRTETLRQLAVTLNHELNNSMAIIEMQLSLLDRRTVQDPGAAAPLREIRAGLVRMSRTVVSLKDIRRVVLVEYPGGQKMIDLARSVADEHPEPLIESPRLTASAGRVAS